MDLSFSIGGVKFEHPLMNGGGVAKNLEDVRQLAKMPVSAVTLGSITFHPKAGNEGNVFEPRHENGYALNSLGLPNPGMLETVKAIDLMIAAVVNAGKRLIVNVAGFNPQEYGVIADAMVTNGAHMAELNGGCPNIWGPDGKQKRIPSFDPEMIDRILTDVTQRLTEAAPIMLKLSPYSDPGLLAEVAEVIASKPVVKAVVCSNTFPNALDLRTNGRPSIDSPQVPDGLAGLSGGAMKPIALGQVRQFRRLLPDRIAIIGSGGVSSGRDMLDYLQAGAVAVQCTTAYLGNSHIFGKILAEYVDHLNID